MIRSKIVHVWEPLTHHIRYDIPSDLVRELFEDEQKLDNFIEQMTKDFLYKLGRCAQFDGCCNSLKKALEQEALEPIEKGENNVCNKENGQNV